MPDDLISPRREAASLMDGPGVCEVSALEFSRLVRAIAMPARSLGLEIPGFRSPPRIAATRTIRRFPGGQSMVAVAIRGRERSAVWFDLVEGLIASNRLDSAKAARVRETLMPMVAEDEMRPHAA